MRAEVRETAILSTSKERNPLDPMTTPRPWIFASITGMLIATSMPAQNPGYTDTPRIPGSRWRVHDAERPRPAVVTPGTATEASPPADAIVLFGGEDLSGWTGRGGRAQWKVEDGFMEVNGTGDIQSREQFGDCQLHIEWATPETVSGTSQERGNSGVFLMGRYEIQVLDSFDNPSYADGQAAAVYGQSPPLVNASRGPGEWQSYDIIFTAPRFGRDGELVEPAYVTVVHNGVLVQNHVKILGPTQHRRAPVYTKHDATGPLQLQDHGNPVRYRNIWVRKLGEVEER